MEKLRNICLQVRYDGGSGSYRETLFAPVMGAAVNCRLFINSLAKENLRPIAFALSKIVSSQIKVKLLLAVGENWFAENGNRSVGNNADLQTLLLQKLSEIPVGATKGQSLPSAFIEMKVCSGDGINSSTFTKPNRTAIFFTDESRDSVACLSNGDSPNALYKQEIAVSWSWGDPTSKVNNEITIFDNLWTAAKEKELVFEADSDLIEKLLDVLAALTVEPEVESSDALGVQLFPHQTKGVLSWMERDYRGVFKMCTGAGKTISALAAVRELGVKRAQAYLPPPPVIVTVPTRVLADQWIREIRQFGFQSVLAAYNSFDQWNNVLEPMLRDKNAVQSRFIVTTYRTFADERFIAKLQRMSGLGVEAVWIADEMHNLASPRLRDSMRKCEKLFKFRLGLSATPEIEGDLTATESLLNYFGNICASYELADGIKDGVLCKYRYYPIPAYLAPAIGKKYLTLLQEINDESGGSTELVNLYREARDLLRTSGVQIARFRDVLKELILAAPDLKHTLVYCPPGYGTYGGEASDEIDKDEGERRLIEEVIEILRSKNLSPASVLGETVAEQRIQILERFADGRVRALCAIGCLDEGVDVPAIKRAIVLYSVDREKQFVQRRGRILRQPRGTIGKIAEIFDIVILPQGADMPRAQAETLLNREMRRYREFARLAENRQEADESISKALSVATNTGSTTTIHQHVNQT